MAQWAKVLTSKADDLSLILETYTMERASSLKLTFDVHTNAPLHTHILSK